MQWQFSHTQLLCCTVPAYACSVRVVVCVFMHAPLWPGLSCHLEMTKGTPEDKMSLALLHSLSGRTTFYTPQSMPSPHISQNRTTGWSSQLIQQSTPGKLSFVKPVHEWKIDELAKKHTADFLLLEFPDRLKQVLTVHFLADYNSPFCSGCLRSHLPWLGSSLENMSTQSSSSPKRTSCHLRGLEKIRLEITLL